MPSKDLGLSLCCWFFQKFKFDRFLNSDGTEKNMFYKEGLRMNYGTMPWGAGSNLCPGRDFAVCALKRCVN